MISKSSYREQVEVCFMVMAGVCVVRLVGCGEVLLGEIYRRRILQEEDFSSGVSDYIEDEDGLYYTGGSVRGVFQNPMNATR